MKYYKVIVAVNCIFFSLLQAQTITQEEFLNHLKKIHPLFDKEKLTAQIEKEQQNSYLGIKDWNILSSVTYSHEEPELAIAGPEKTNAFAVSGGIEKMFWNTGGRLSASYSAYYADIVIDPLWGFPSSFYQNQLSITYTHPLLKNRKGFLDRLEYELKQFDIDFSEVQANENMEDFLAGSAAKFLDWVYLNEQKEIIAERLKLSEEEFERTKRKRSANLVDQADVIRTEDAVRYWKQNQVLIESQERALQAELSVLLQNDEINNLEPELDLYKVEKKISLKDAINKFKKTSRVLKTLNLRLKQLEFTRKGYEETAKPDLSVLVQLNTKELDESLGKSFKMDKSDAVIGFQFSFPIENRTAKSQIEKIDLQISQLEHQINELTLTLTSAITNLNIQLKEMENILVLNKEQIESSKERTKEELKLYNQGRGDLTFVIMSRDNEQNAKLTYASNALMYHKLSLDYKALMDELLVIE
jgi:outer membrane protein TolC